MPPKQRITREMILERSFAMFCREGMDAVNARSVAKALNCSTQPIFSYFSGMDDLKNALDQKARNLFEELINPVTKEGRLFERYCIEYVRFAQEQPQLFGHMFLRVQDMAGAMTMNGMLRDAMVEVESRDEGISLIQAREVGFKLWIYAHGLASMQASGHTDIDMAQAQTLISDMHALLVQHARTQQ